MDLTRVEIDGTQRKVIFRGDCLEMSAVCKAMCCREWKVDISAEEHASGLYQAEIICKLKDKACSNTSLKCINRLYLLNKRDDKSCVYLEENRCLIYNERPRTCRDFMCKGGWRLDSVFSANTAQTDQKTRTFTKETFVALLTEDMTFVLHPLLKVHSVFYLKPHNEIIFIKEMVGSCGKFNTRDSFDYPQLSDDRIMALINLFACKEPLGQIYRRYCFQSENPFAWKDFFEIVWLLNKHNIVLDSRNFNGMLGGMGGI
jgi:Fe-S-cluster containining protein